MGNIKKTRIVKIAYKFMFILMDIESGMWWIAEKLIYPVAKLRRNVAVFINNSRIKE